MIRFDFDTYRNNLITEESIDDYNTKLNDLNTYFNNHKDMMGWYNLNYKKELMDDISQTSKFIRDNCDVFLVIGIGGSYMGALSVIESLNPYFYNEFKTPKIYFVGTSLSSKYINDLKKLIKNKDIIINVISKSGNTLEIMTSYELIMDLMHQKYDSEELKKRVIITTGSNNKLESEALNNGYKLLNVPNDTGGRFSVFTPVGLLPIAVSGINIEELFKGIEDANKDLKDKIKYAVIRHILNKKGKTVEAYVVYEPKLYALTEWLKQLYAESLGKEGKGILPIGIINTRDLHSLGQFIQEGKNLLFETNIIVKDIDNDIYIKKYNKTLNQINNLAVTSVSISHKENDVVSNIIELDKLNEYNIGYLLQFFMISVSISAFLDDINAFNQDGVEKYKNILNKMIQQ